MLIRYGYEITSNCAQPTAFVCLLSVHDDHAKAIRVPERVFTTPIMPMTTYRDLFGNQCRRLVAPVGDLTLWGDATSLMTAISLMTTIRSNACRRGPKTFRSVIVAPL